jgi:hypothetical protein
MAGCPPSPRSSNSFERVAETTAKGAGGHRFDMGEFRSN